MAFICTIAFIVVDFVTGLANAIKEKKCNSSIMRTGLFHKFGSIIIVLVGYLIDYAQHYIDLGFNVNISIGICVYIITMEIMSIIENVGKLNPNILPNKLKDIFEKL